MFDIFFHNESRACSGLGFEPESIDTFDRMVVEPTAPQKIIYDDFIKDIKLSQGLCLGTRSLYQRFAYIYIRASHDKQASLLNWVKDDHDGTEVGTIRYDPYVGVGGISTAPIAYINNNFIPATDHPWGVSVKFGGYVDEDYRSTICGARDTRTGSGAHAGWLTPSQTWVMQSWGTNTRIFEDPNLEGFYEAVRNVYGTNVTAGHYQGVLNTDTRVEGVRNPPINWYSCARNNINGSTGISGTPQQVNNVGFLRFEYFGWNQINSVTLLSAIEKYLEVIDT